MSAAAIFLTIILTSSHHCDIISQPGIYIHMHLPAIFAPHQRTHTRVIQAAHKNAGGRKAARRAAAASTRCLSRQFIYEYSLDRTAIALAYISYRTTHKTDQHFIEICFIQSLTVC